MLEDHPYVMEAELRYRREKEAEDLKRRQLLKQAAEGRHEALDRRPTAGVGIPRVVGRLLAAAGLAAIVLAVVMGSMSGEAGEVGDVDAVIGEASAKYPLPDFRLGAEEVPLEAALLEGVDTAIHAGIGGLDLGQESVLQQEDILLADDGLDIDRYIVPRTRTRRLGRVGGPAEEH